MNQNSTSKGSGKLKWIILAVVFLVFIGGMVFSYSHAEKTYLKELIKTKDPPRSDCCPGRRTNSNRAPGSFWLY